MTLFCPLAGALPSLAANPLPIGRLAKAPIIQHPIEDYGRVPSHLQGSLVSTIASKHFFGDVCLRSYQRRSFGHKGYIFARAKGEKRPKLQSFDFYLRNMKCRRLSLSLRSRRGSLGRQMRSILILCNGHMCCLRRRHFSVGIFQLISSS
jgi:hypothetical protein